MKKLTFLILSACLAFHTFAEKVDVEKAKSVAKNFYFAQLEQLVENKNVFTQPEDLRLSNTFEIASDGNTLLHVVNLESGFVIVSGNDAVEPILAYSLENSFSGEDLPPAVAGLLEWYKAQINYAFKNNLQKTDDINQAWENLSGAGGLKSGSCEIWPKTYSKSPLITTLWGQGGYYKEQCPYDDVEGKYTPAGCTAVAMAQVMKFWNRPAQGSGAKSYQDSNDPANSYYNSANFGSTTYNWANMPNAATYSTGEYIAKLIYHCGVSVETDYGYEKSSTESLSAVENALETYFGYSTFSDFIEKSSYSSTNWDNILRSNLDSRKPVVYRGDDGEEGHAFVLDGYTKTIYETYGLYTYYHINWGWEGDYNGYFTLTDLTPDIYDFNSRQAAVVGISHPSATYSTPPQPSSINAACSGSYCMGETYEFSVSPIDLATEYEWVVTGYPCGAYISNSLNYASVYAIFPSTNTIKVRAKNGSATGAWRTYPFVVTDCYNKSSSIGNNETSTQQTENLNQLELENNNNQIDEIQIFPNPAKNDLTIFLSAKETAEIKIFDLKGSLCKILNTNNNKIVVNTSELNNGLYLIKIVTNSRNETRKIEIQK